jgi:hypothetical protein
MTETIDAFIFYFDLIGVVDQFLSQQGETLERLRQFQARARARFPFGEPHCTVKTLADNVWARVNASEHTGAVGMLELAARVMEAAHEFCFPNYFGVITRGDHVFDVLDRTTVTGSDPTDFLVQHIDMTSEPHIRAALAEKWSASLARDKLSPVPVPSVWISEEVFPERDIEDAVCGLSLPFVVRRERFDLSRLPGPAGKQWPFPHARFRAITAK